MASLVLDSVRKVYPNGVPGVQRVDLDIEAGEFVALVGPSGCGKSTTLRMVAGFESCSGGRVLIDDKDVTHLPPEKRPTAMVFQDYALFPHLDVRSNIAFGLRARRQAGAMERVGELARMLRLEDVLDRPIGALSGGQRQRVALGRALSVRPSILLLDEPLGALDASLRKEVQSELKLLQRKLGITFLFVTHSQSEALALSDRIVVMNAGLVEQVSTPEVLCTRPASRFVARFIGRNLVLEGKQLERRGDDAKIATSLGPVMARGPQIVGESAVALNLDRVEIRHLESSATHPDEGLFMPAEVLAHRHLAGRVSISLGLSDGSKISVERREDRLDTDAMSVGSRVNVCWTPEDATLVPA